MKVVNILFCLMVIITIIIIVYFIYDYMTYQKEIDTSIEITADYMNNSFETVEKNMYESENLIADNIQKNLNNSYDTIAKLKKNDGILNNNIDIVGKNMQKIDKNIKVLDSQLRSFFKFDTKPDVVDNTYPDMKLLSKVTGTKGLTVITPNELVNQKNFKICDKNYQCIDMNVSDKGFSITPTNVNNMVINGGDNNPLVSFNLRDNEIYLGGNDNKSPFFIRDNELYMQKINMLLGNKGDISQKSTISAEDLNNLGKNVSNVSYKLSNVIETIRNKIKYDKEIDYRNRFENTVNRKIDKEIFNEFKTFNERERLFEDKIREIMSRLDKKVKYDNNQVRMELENKLRNEMKLVYFKEKEIYNDYRTVEQEQYNNFGTLQSQFNDDLRTSILNTPNMISLMQDQNNQLYDTQSAEIDDIVAKLEAYLETNRINIAEQQKIDAQKNQIIQDNIQQKLNDMYQKTEKEIASIDSADKMYKKMQYLRDAQKQQEDAINNSVEEAIRNNEVAAAVVKATVPVDCLVGNWSEWTNCTSNCGGGTKTRRREIIRQSSYGGSNCPPLKETEGCNPDACPVDCVLSDWTWTDCTSNCGGGKKYAYRTIQQVALNNGKACDTLLTSNIPCNPQPCPLTEVGQLKR